VLFDFCLSRGANKYMMGRTSEEFDEVAVTRVSAFQHGLACEFADILKMLSNEF
jgi:hypothetical protein